MSKDYRGFEDKIGGDLSKASLQAQTLEQTGSKKSSTQKLRVRGSDLPALIPAGSVIEFEAVPVSKLKFGDIVFCRFDKELCLRRFIRIRYLKNRDAELHVTQQGPNNMVQILPCGALVGRVISAESRGNHYNPRKLESAMTSLTNRITEFGTTSVGDRVLGYLQFFKSMMKK